MSKDLPQPRPPPPLVPRLVAETLIHPATLLFARLMLILPYWVSGLTKLLDFPAAARSMAGMGLHPAWAFVVLTILLQIGASLLVIVDRWTWLGAGALGVFTVLATFLVHRFWDGDGPLRSEPFNAFLEHAALAAAFILVGAVSMMRERDDRP